jgi:PAS domain S-box-containing protein
VHRRGAGRVSVVLLLAAFVVVGTIAFFAQRRFGAPRLDRTKIYRIGYGNDAPLHFKGVDGRPTGLAVELVHEAARRKGIQLQWVEGTGFNQQLMDLWVLHTITPERAKSTHLTEAYLQTESCFLVPAASALHGLDDLRTARIGHANYAVHRNALARILPEATLVPAADSKQALAKLTDGASDAAFISKYAVVETLLSGGGQSMPLRILLAPATRSQLAISSTFANAAVADEIRDGMRAMAMDGVVAPMLERWSHFPKLATDVIGELVVAERRIRWLAVGLVTLVAVSLTAAALAILSRRRTAQLRRTERLLHQVADRVPGVMYQFLLRPDGTSCFPYVSDACQQIFGVSPEEARANAASVFALLSPAERERVDASIHKSAAELSPWNLEFPVHLPDGTERWLCGNALPQRVADGATLWHGFISDVTERRRADAALHAFEHKMQEAQKLESLAVLAGGIAHDFNNLLTGILGNVSLARSELHGESSARGFLDKVKEAGLRAAGLCSQMLAYSGRGRFVVKPLALNQLVTETVRLLQHSIGRQVVLRFNLAAELPPIEADAAQIKQVITNLVINASEAIGDASGMIHLNTGVRQADEAFLRDTVLARDDLPAGPYVYLEICDTGCGMNAETQTRIFDPFFSTKFTGRGLGLAAVLGIVRGHRGALKVDSAPDRGTTFLVLFPPAPGAAVASAETRSPAVLPTAAG